MSEPTLQKDASSTQQTESQQSSKLWDRIMANGPMIAAVSVSLLFCLIIGSLFWPFLFGNKDETLLRELSNFEVARGLITFLVAVTTVGIALILTVYVVVTQDGAAEKKFILGKEVLTGLIGVLGTIIGFYFGASNPPKKNRHTRHSTSCIQSFKSNLGA